ncbi:LysR family transcriptional regulator [Pseudomonas sp. GB2N2]
MDNLNNLSAFVQIVKYGSFASAATHMGVTPPAISKSIAKLESELGARLFNRTTRKVHLTPEGQAFFERIDGLLEGIGDAVDAISRTSVLPKGTVRVSVASTFGRHCLLPVMADFFKQYPDIHVELYFDDGPTSLVGQGFDLCIRHGQGDAMSPISRSLCLYPIILVASPEYLAIKGVPKSPEDLKHFDCIGVRLPNGTLGQWSLERAAAIGVAHNKRVSPPPFLFSPKSSLTVAQQIDASLVACLSSCGIAPSAVPVVMPHLLEGRLNVVLPDYRLQSAGHIMLQYPHRDAVAQKVRVFVDFLLERFQEFGLTHDLEQFTYDRRASSQWSGAL